MISCRTKWFLITFIIADTLFSLWLVGFILFGIKINDYKIDKTTKTEAVVVLTGGRHRVAEAIKILNKGLAQRLFISGVSEKVSIGDIENKTGERILYPEYTDLGYKATNTIQNAEEIIEWLQKNHITSLRLVTSNYHIPRSLAELSAYNLPLKIIPHPVYSEKISEFWWGSWKTFKFIAGEYNKFLFVKLRNLLKF